jgi:hypothetical protein
MLKNILVCQDTDEDLLDSGNYFPKKAIFRLEKPNICCFFSGTPSIREKRERK